MEMQTLRNIAFCLMLFSAHLFAQSKDPRRYAATGPVFEASAGYVFMSMTSPATSRLNLQGVDANGLLQFSPHWGGMLDRSEEHTSELQSRQYLVCRLLLEKKKKKEHYHTQL